MNRRECIHDDDQVFGPETETQTNDGVQQVLLCLPAIAFLLAGYVWMFLDLLGV